MNKTQTILLNGKFYKQEFKQYHQKINSIINTQKYQICIFYSKSRSNNYFSINQERIFKNLGLNVEKILINDEKEFLLNLRQKSQDPKVIGINVELPLPKNFNPDLLQEINPNKDLDCLNPINYYKFISSKKEDLNYITIPSVAYAVYLILTHYSIEFEKKDIVILGKSLYTGLAIFHLLLKFNSTIQILNEYSSNPQLKCKNADIIISATGKIGIINKEYITEKSVIIDVGFEVQNGIIKGDVDFESVNGIAKAVSIVPGGIGLLCNFSTIINLYKLITR